MIHKIGFINGSPKSKNNSCSQMLIDYFSDALQDTYETKYEVHTFNYDSLNIDEIGGNLSKCDVIVIVAPLYIDSLPSTLLKFLRQFELFYKAHPELFTPSTQMYGFLNCGFLGGEQNHVALKILMNFATRMDYNWCGGVGLGSGAQFRMTHKKLPPQCKLHAPIYAALRTFITCIKERSPINSPQKLLYISQDISNFDFISKTNIKWGAKSKWDLKRLRAKPYLKK